DQNGSNHHSLPVQHRHRAVTRQGMNSSPITAVPRLDMSHRLFVKLREGQTRDAIDRDRAAIGARTVLRGAVQVSSKEERPTRRSARADIHFHRIPRMRPPWPEEVEG